MKLKNFLILALSLAFVMPLFAQEKTLKRKVAIGRFSNETQYAKMYEEKPLTFLMPPINNTTNVDAKEYLFTSISRPIVESGYYVISPMLSMEIMKSESAYDAELFIDGDQSAFRKYFGADAVIYTEINSWAKQGFGITTDLRYIMKSTVTYEVLFERSCHLYLDLSVSNSEGGAFGALFALAASAINTAATEHITAARKANYYILRDMPRGKYSPDYMLDMETPAEERNVNVYVK